MRGNNNAAFGNGLFWYDADKNFISVSYPSAGGGYKLTSPSNAYYFRIHFGSSYGLTYLNDVAVNNPSTVTAYEPYTTTVYAGTIEVVSGVLRVDSAKTKTQDLNWTAGNRNTADTGRIFYARLYGVIKDASDIISDTLKGVAYTYPSWESLPVNVITSANGGFVICCADCADKTEFLSEFGGSEFVYELAEPLTFQLTPQEITSLVGQNNVWSNAGSVKVVI